MRMSTFLTLAVASLASAQASGNGTNPDNGGGTKPVNGFPGQLGADFRLYGCVRSQNQFPGWRRVSMMPNMDLNFCAASCDTKYMGVQGTDCYCGSEIDSQTTRVDLNLCSTKCPGNANQFCGGIMSLGKRQAVPSNVLLTVYVREGNNAGSGTTTVTQTSTSTGTITSCPPTVTNCPIGSKTVAVQTITSTFCPQPTPDYKKIVCYGDKCFAGETCDSCASHRVVCRDGHCWVENCDTADHGRLVICEGDKCEYACGQQGKVVCYGDHCDIQECWGDACKQKIVNYEPCTGPSCPTPAPPSPTPAPPCYGPSCNVTPPKNSTVPPVVAGAGSVLPAAGAVFGLVAGVAALL